MSAGYMINPDVWLLGLLPEKREEINMKVHLSLFIKYIFAIFNM